MPRLWTDTVESHRHEVRESILDAAGRLVADRGLLAVSMSQVADGAGIGRATLYKYFGDVEEVLAAWHARAVASHLTELAALAEGAGGPAERLRSVLEAYGQICRQRARHGAEWPAAAFHRTAEVQQPEDQLRDLVTQLIAEVAGTAAAGVRIDVPADVLAAFCVSALAAAGAASSDAEVQTVVDLVWAGLTAQPDTRRGG